MKQPRNGSSTDWIGKAITMLAATLTIYSVYEILESSVSAPQFTLGVGVMVAKQVVKGLNNILDQPPARKMTAEFNLR